MNLTGTAFEVTPRESQLVRGLQAYYRTQLKVSPDVADMDARFTQRVEEKRARDLRDSFESIPGPRRVPAKIKIQLGQSTSSTPSSHPQLQPSPLTVTRNDALESVDRMAAAIIECDMDNQEIIEAGLVSLRRAAKNPGLYTCEMVMAIVKQMVLTDLSRTADKVINAEFTMASFHKEESKRLLRVLRQQLTPLAEYRRRLLPTRPPDTGDFVYPRGESAPQILQKSKHLEAIAMVASNCTRIAEQLLPPNAPSEVCAVTGRILSSGTFVDAYLFSRVGHPVVIAYTCRDKAFVPGMQLKPQDVPSYLFWKYHPISLIIAWRGLIFKKLAIHSIETQDPTSIIHTLFNHWEYLMDVLHCMDNLESDMTDGTMVAAEAEEDDFVCD